MAWEIQHVNPQLAAFRIRESHADAVALHHVPYAGGDLVEQLAQFQLAHDSVRQIEKELQSLLRPRIVYRYGDLISDQGQEALLVRRVCVLEPAGKPESSQNSICGAEREDTS